MKTSEQERFLQYVDKTSSASGCWLWTSTIGHNGYGQFHLRLGRCRYKNTRAHRYAYEEFVGEIPAGHLILHRCDVRNCVNPDHLFTGTQKQNIADMFSKGRAALLSARDRGVAKLTTDQVRAIRADARLQREIAAEYGVGISTVSLIKSKKLWPKV